ncbi:MAG: PhnD/SsuA/transferrin family substrate-binding protein [Anaerolineae bacterium]|nr:PhnD/SsuA/transferrin family substrate-binding protein [Anaerolineae bacterium]
MKRHYPAVWLTVLGLLLAAMTLAACGGPITPTPIPLPTATATPRSTPLPEVPTAVPLASEERPLVLYLLAQGETPDEEQAAALAAQIGELSGLTVQVAFAESYGEIVAQLCSASPAAGWLDGLAYVAAEAQGCADPALEIRRGRAAGYRVDLLVNADIAGEIPDAGDIPALAGRDFCRVSATDEVSWLVGGLLLQRGGVDPFYDLDEIIDVEDYDALVEAVYDGQCMAGAVPADYMQDDLSEELSELEDLEERILVVETSAEIPYGLLVYPQTVPLNVRIPLNEVFVQLVADDDDVLEMLPALDDLEPVTRADFDDLRAFMQETGLDFTALGE